MMWTIACDSQWLLRIKLTYSYLGETLILGWTHHQRWGLRTLTTSQLFLPASEVSTPVQHTCPAHLSSTPVQLCPAQELLAASQEDDYLIISHFLYTTVTRSYLNGLFASHCTHMVITVIWIFGTAVHTDICHDYTASDRIQKNKIFRTAKTQMDVCLKETVTPLPLNLIMGSVFLLL